MNLGVAVDPAMDAGIVGVHEHRAARRILTDDGALRAPQDFHPVDE